MKNIEKGKISELNLIKNKIFLHLLKKNGFYPLIKVENIKLFKKIMMILIMNYFIKKMLIIQ